MVRTMTSSSGEVNKDRQERMEEGTITAIMTTIGEVTREETFDGEVRRVIHHYMISREAVDKK
jgi:hypothetical protein